MRGIRLDTEIGLNAQFREHGVEGKVSLYKCILQIISIILVKKSSNSY